jgi:hypothetical protein
MRVPERANGNACAKIQVSLTVAGLQPRAIAAHESDVGAGVGGKERRWDGGVLRVGHGVHNLERVAKIKLPPSGAAAKKL